MNTSCPLCKTIELIKINTDPFFVKEMKSGYVVICHHQFYKGYMLFISKVHKQELHELDQETKQIFLLEMSMVAEAIYKIFHPIKLNYELLGNTVSHLHWHLIPRHKDDPNISQPIWTVDKDIRCAEEYRPTLQELKLIKKKMLSALT
jgi:diadenosine tetraphosphate (Ap4A) HIT family hydrolase